MQNCCLPWAVWGESILPGRTVMHYKTSHHRWAWMTQVSWFWGRCGPLLLQESASVNWHNYADLLQLRLWLWDWKNPYLVPSSSPRLLVEKNSRNKTAEPCRWGKWDVKFQETKVCLEKRGLKNGSVIGSSHLFLHGLSCSLVLYGCRARLFMSEFVHSFTVEDMNSAKATRVPALILKCRLACGIFCVSTWWLFICASQSLNPRIYVQCLINFQLFPMM